MEANVFLGYEKATYIFFRFDFVYKHENLEIGSYSLKFLPEELLSGLLSLKNKEKKHLFKKDLDPKTSGLVENMLTVLHIYINN